MSLGSSCPTTRPPAHARFTRLRRASTDFVRLNTGALRSLRSLVPRALPHSVRQDTGALRSLVRRDSQILRICSPPARGVAIHLFSRPPLQRSASTPSTTPRAPAHSSRNLGLTH